MSENHTVQVKKKRKKKSFFRRFLGFLFSVALAAAAVYGCWTYLFRIVTFGGDSMNPTIYDHEHLFVSLLDKERDGVARGDVVLCRYSNESEAVYVKRIVAVPGDQMYRENGVTHIVYQEDGQRVDEKLDERYAANFPDGSSDDYALYTLGADEYFVAGDNRYYSDDSRNWKDSDPSDDVGPIREEMLIGKVRYVIWPWENIREVA